MLLYVGPATAQDASHEGWQEWFENLGDNLVDRGSPLADGLGLHRDGSTSGSTTRLNGYSIIQAKDTDAVPGLVKAHPYLTQDDEYSIEVYSLP
jgi:hypothetical protein